MVVVCAGNKKPMGKGMSIKDSRGDVMTWNAKNAHHANKELMGVAYVARPSD